MIEILVFILLGLAFILMAIVEHKRNMEHIEFKEKIARMRYQMKNLSSGDRRDTDNDKEEPQ